MIDLDFKKGTRFKDDSENLYPNYLKNKDVNPSQITHAAIDMSVPFISGSTKYFPDTAEEPKEPDIRTMVLEILVDRIISEAGRGGSFG